MPHPTPECLDCGVCCFSPSHEYVWVNGADWKLLGADAERLAHFIGNRAFMKMSGGHCAALEIRPGTDGRKVFFCTIYEKRPIICHALGRGSPECEAVLEEHRERPYGGAVVGPIPDTPPAPTPNRTPDAAPGPAPAPPR
jgi:hypothetical protein